MISMANWLYNVMLSDHFSTKHKHNTNLFLASYAQLYLTLISFFLLWKCEVKLFLCLFQYHATKAYRDIASCT